MQKLWQASQASEDFMIHRQMLKEGYGRCQRSQDHAVLIDSGKVNVLHDEGQTKTSNAVKELLGQMVRPNKEHWKAVE